MSNLVQISPIEAALVQGDLSKLTIDQRGSHYNDLCTSLDLNPLTKPFEYIILNGKLTLYARKDCTDQLRTKRSVSITRVEKEVIEGILTVTVFAKDANGREDTDMGAVDLSGLRGEKLANAMMKAITKAKRRVTLSICGLGMLDETEVADIADARPPAPETEARALEYDAHGGSDIPADPSNVEDYIIPIGKMKGIALKDADIFQIENLRKWLLAEEKKTKKPLSTAAVEFVNMAEDFLKTREFVREARTR